jgi:hypothetical protein
MYLSGSQVRRERERERERVDCHVSKKGPPVSKKKKTKGVSANDREEEGTSEREEESTLG